jgi:hypothetical protein
VFALDSVSSLEVSRGKSSQFGKGLLIGLVVGGGGGAMVGAIAGASGSFCIDTCLDAGSGAAAGAFFGILPGLVVGAVAGALTETDRWEAVPLDRLRVSYAPRRDGFAFGMRVAF